MAEQVSEGSGRRLWRAAADLKHDVFTARCVCPSALDEVANILATRYEGSFDVDTEEPALWPRAEVAPVSLGELKTVLHKMKNGKAADATGMRVEFIKMLDEADLIQWLDAANRTLKNTRHERAAHKNVEFFMDLKPRRKGDNLNNWRPIALLPIFAKIVAKIMASRIQEVLDKTPDYNDAGFKAGFATDDILYVAEQLFERARSAGIPVAVLVADVKKGV